jgi:hypothetical protein
MLANMSGLPGDAPTCGTGPGYGVEIRPVRVLVNAPGLKDLGGGGFVVNKVVLVYDIATPLKEGRR